MKKLLKGCIVVAAVGTLLTAVGFQALGSFSAQASGGSIWSTTNPPTMTVDERQKSYEFPYVPPAECSREKIYLGNDPIRSSVCLVERDGWRFGKYSYPNLVAAAADRSGYAIGFGQDTKMYRLRGLEHQSAMLGPNTNAFRQSNGYYDVLSVLLNPESKVQKITNSTNGAVEYRYNWLNNPDVVLADPAGHDLRVGVMAVTPNGRWLAVEAIGRGIVFVDLKTEEIKLVSRARGSSSNRGHLAQHIAISDNGRYIVTAGMSMRETVISVTKNCGVQLSDDEQLHGGRPLSNPCEELDLWSYFQHNVDTYAHAVFPVFGAGGTTLNINVFSYTDGAQWVTLKTGDDNPPLPTEPVFHLDYLALGDSYSSGEGDTEKDLLTGQKYYLPHTDTEGGGTVPKEKCHISSRSYPFVLTKMMGIANTRMESVACSGALVSKDYAQDNEDYYGQGERLKALGSDGMIEAYKADALNEFIPGRNQQIEFVREYQPKAITLTGGGNDAGFGKVAIACASGGACDFSNTTEGKTRLGKAIGNQYGHLASLYRDLHEASRHTKIYVLGYPQFFSEEHGLCGANVRFNQEERIMARAAVTYMNNVIEAAAETAGVEYIDIEQSLGENILCSGQESYVTGLAMSGKITADIPELFSQESFHPNAKGHQKIAEAVRAALGDTRLDEYEYCNTTGETNCPIAWWLDVEPEVPDFFAEAMSGDATNYVHSEVLDKNIIQKGKDTLRIELEGLKPNTAVSVWLFSSPTNLGIYTTDVSGNLSMDIPIPENIPAGAHTLQLESETFSDEPIALWQIVWVAGREGDIDEDGSQDTSQACLFTQDSGLDHDKDGVDDACDLEVERSELASEPELPSDTTGQSVEVYPGEKVKVEEKLEEDSQKVSLVDDLGVVPVLSSKGIGSQVYATADVADADIKGENTENHPLGVLYIVLGIGALTMLLLLLKGVASSFIADR